ncbi:hypothetical protein A8C56_02800 [Niabella ginsenosidivorans]|uniref:Uncharacterized protein n=1 Tax=Niabella ginsenosidivorans TaxID=1176587 RepID=A0A1A9I044_9BACT|nr:hypothetical protein A8C56_02800 [Niabella ginsenosidivorans]
MTQLKAGIGLLLLLFISEGVTGCALKDYTIPAVDSPWVNLGAVNSDVSDNYALYHYKLLQVAAAADPYAMILDINVLGDVNYYNRQALYRIYVTKYTGTQSRFDGLEIECTSGNPEAAIFYVYNNEVWVRSRYQWGSIQYKIIRNFAAKNPVPATVTRTLTVPTGFLASTQNYGLKCDFDNNVFIKLPYRNAAGNFLVDGNILTGKTSQANAAYKLDVNGDVRANKLVVNTSGADFVFDSAYRLRSLSEVKAFIRNNKHLPEIQSAAEMQAEGLDVGDSQTKLLQKIEELTMYLIELEERAATQQKRYEEKLTALHKQLKILQKAK